MKYRKLAKRTLLAFMAATVGLVATFAMPASRAVAANVSITSPANGQSFTGNNFNVTGQADAGASIFLLRDGKVIKQTRADTSGNWSATLNALPDGQNDIQVRAIKATGFGYFMGKEEGDNPISVHQLRFTDNALNVSSGFPFEDPNGHSLLVPDPNSSRMMAAGYALGDNPVPAIIDVSNPGTIQSTEGYEETNTANTGSFSGDGSKYFSANILGDGVTVIDALSVEVIAEIPMDSQVITTWRSPQGAMYAARYDDKLSVINEQTNEVIKTIDFACEDGVVSAATFSYRADYPYYFVHCTSGTITKLKVADDTIVSTFPQSFFPTVAVLSPDESKLYVSSSVGLNGSMPNPFGDKIFVVNAETGALMNTIQLTNGSYGIGGSPDLQHLYVATSGFDFDTAGFDIIDMNDDSVQHIDNNVIALGIATTSSAATVSNVSVSVILGVTSGQLAKTGVFVVLASPLGLFLIAAVVYSYTDYRRHKLPLLAVDPSVNYSYFHHLRVVSIPLVRYRLSVSVDKRVDDERSDDITRY